MKKKNVDAIQNEHDKRREAEKAIPKRLQVKKPTHTD